MRAAYDRWASQYDTDPNKTRDLDGALVRALPERWRQGDVLELGCGTGKNSTWLLQGAQSLTGLDLSPQMLARCQQRAPQARLLEADLTTAWPIQAHSVDVLHANLVLEHIDDLRHIAHQAWRALRPGGLVRLCELHPWRQLRGAAAHFHQGGQRVDMFTVYHSVQDYVMSFLGQGFVLESLGEHFAHGDEPTGPPRLLSLCLRRG